MIDFLILLLPAALRAEAVTAGRAPFKPYHWRTWTDFVALVAAFILDVIICHTTWALMYGWPKEGEVTISHTLERLCHPDNKDHPDFDLLWQIALKINRVAEGPHIKIVNDARRTPQSTI